MRLKYYSKKKLDKKVKEIVGKYLDLKGYSLFYFGSRVTERGNERSDIDIGIKGSQKIQLETMSKIKEDIDNLPTLYSIDIVDFNGVSENFRKVALQEVEKII